MASKVKIPGPPYFCPACGTIFTLPDQKNSDGETISCDCCNYKCSMNDLENNPLVSVGNTKKMPKWLSTDSVVEQHHATVEEPCPKCDAPEVEYYTRQIRSADEGQTVFYECPECGHKWNENT